MILEQIEPAKTLASAPTAKLCNCLSNLLTHFFLKTRQQGPAMIISTHGKPASADGSNQDPGYGGEPLANLAIC
jgi:ABC-type ATPase involved in cell division